jgi:chromosome partitioning protein
MKTRIISFFIQKGGTGKTACVANIGAGLARMGRRVLLIDLDPQGNLALSLGAAPGPVTSYDVLTGRGEGWARELAEVEAGEEARAAGGSLAILPAARDLAAVDREITGEAGHETRLRDAIRAEASGKFDFILFDNPPTVNAAVINGLCAAREVFAPVKADFLSIAGMSQLAATIEAARKGGLNPALRLSGIILTFFDGRTNLSRLAAEQLREAFPAAVFAAAIRETVTIGEAPASGRDVFRYAPASGAAEDFRQLCAEITGEAGNHERNP